MGKRPSFQFYPGDWLEDIGLRASSLAARGLWADLLCFMHQGEPYGHLRKNGENIGQEQLARMVGESRRCVTVLLAELEKHNVLSRNSDGTIYSRRQVRDEALREARAKGGLEGGDAAEKNPRASRRGDRREGGRPSSYKGGRQGGRQGGSGGGAEGGNSVTPPSSPSPSPSPERTNGTDGDRPPVQATAAEARQVATAVLGAPGRANPLMAAGARGKWELECLSLVRRMSALTGEDGATVMARASGYQGSTRTKLNPASMSDDRLMNTVLDLRADVVAEEKRRAAKQPGV